MPDRILVVDDEEPIREIVASMLGTAGYACKQASSGMEALAVLNSGEDFELMLSDLMMADLDGIGLLERTKEKYPDMPVVMVTAVHDISVALAAIRNGAYDYLLKPFEREQLQATVRELERSYDMTLEALGDALDMKDAETEGHSRRVTAFTIVIAKAMGLPPEQIPTIARGAFLHDIGKLAIPDAILRKPGKLTPDEMAIMQEHCFKGYQIVKKIPFLVEACDIVYSHQERYDGTGYPRRLKGEEIPLGARIFSVADTLDAMTVDRVYRPAQPYQAAREEIIRWSGRQFDPEVVRAFVEIPEDIWDRLRKDIDSQISRIAYSAGAKG